MYGQTLAAGGGSSGGTPNVGKKTSVMSSSMGANPGAGGSDDWQTQSGAGKKSKGKKGKQSSSSGGGSSSSSSASNTPNKVVLDISEPKYWDNMASGKGPASAEEMEQSITNLLQEYFISADTKDTATSIQELIKGTLPSLSLSIYPTVLHISPNS